MKSKGLSMRTRKALLGYVFISPFLVGLLLFIIWPIISSFIMSFSNVKIDPQAGGFTMEFIGLKNYTDALFVDPFFNRYVTEAAYSMLLYTPCVIIFSILIAVLLNRKFPGRGAVRAIFFIPVILTSGVILNLDKSNSLLNGALQVQSSNADTSITTTIQNLMLGIFGSNFQISDFVVRIIDSLYDIVVSSSIQTVIFLSALQSISPSIYEAAKCEGCSQWELFWKITLPMISPMILVCWIYTVIDSFMKSDSQVMMKIMNAVNVTLNYGSGAAMAWVYCIVALVFVGISSLIISRMVYYYD